jgi:hypothetical protein
MVVSGDLACRPRGSVLHINDLSARQVREMPFAISCACGLPQLDSFPLPETGPCFVASQLSNLPGMRVKAREVANSERRKSPPRCVRRLSSTMKTAGRRKPLTAGGGATFDLGPVGRTNRHGREAPPDSVAEVWHRSWAAACFLKLVNILADKPEISGRCHGAGSNLVRIRASPGFSSLLVSVEARRDQSRGEGDSRHMC